MPRLNHRKARTGCQRCKARKVKCDEVKPKCTACARHNVQCEYVEPAPRRTEQNNGFGAAAQEGYAGGGPDANNELRGLDPRLEVRLMHEWTAYTCQSFSIHTEFWRFQAPLFAMEHRLVLDAMFGLAALDFSRRAPSQWIPMDGRLVPVRDPLYKPSYATKDVSAQWKGPEDQTEAANAVRNAHHPDFVAVKRSQEMLMNARMYFDRAIDGHQRGLTSLTKDNVEAVYITSILVSFHALFTLNEDGEESRTLPIIDPLVWFRLADGTRYLCDVWRQFVGEEWLESAGVYFGREKLTEEEALFRDEAGKPFDTLLTSAEDYEETSEEDKDAYQKCLAYLALVYKSIVEGIDPPLVNCRRLVALPSRLPKRFSDLAEQRSPRALVFLAHAFALMKLVSDKVPWFQGIADRQIPKINHTLTLRWQELMVWPMKVTEGKIDPKTEETDIRDILSL